MHTRKSITLRRALGALASILVLSAGPVAAQSALGTPFIGDNSLTFYMTELPTDGIGQPTSTLFGGRYGRRFRSTASPASFSLAVQGAARATEGPTDGVMDVSVTAGWSRRMEEIDRRLSVTAAAGASALLWGSGDPDSGLVRASLPLTVGVSYDLRIGPAILTPFAAPAVAYYRARQVVDDVRLMDETGWDARISSGASLRFREVVLSTTTIRGEEGLPHRSRWAFAAGISF